MLGKLTNGKIVIGACSHKSLKEMIDRKRGDIPRRSQTEQSRRGVQPNDSNIYIAKSKQKLPDPPLC
jgi:hypothetical protein